MAFSINTNAGAMVALQNLNKTGFELSKTQNRINTGLKVSGAKDDASIFAIAQKMRGTLAGKSAIAQGLDRARSILDVSIAAAESISDTLIQMKELAVRAAQSGLDTSTHNALNADFFQFRSQIDTIALNAEFNGKNMVIDTASSLEITTDENGNSITVPPAAMQAITLQFGLPNKDLYTSTNASGTITTIDNAIDAVNGHMSSLGSASKRVDLMSTMNEKIMDAIEVGVGNLVDADMARESANLESLQVKQQLGLQALSIANQAPNTVLSLFN